ncbi:NADP-dependent oxidoreductase [Phenylobacterium montanum]|uniref:NADP-dependent oxidoreductase n=1 Tax=Phenylobacterium montanum TaxID=2823693 RepID=A0A975FWF5_9CAUL|nr:NADP-dependent oxidoreductase [Caulobacter sp. S6]QUD86728.1 NADP-dependent oxidoreductase [Caulobacter sp. S6]
MSLTNHRWVLRHRPHGEIKPTDLDYVAEPVRDLAEGEVLIRNVYLSLDPTNRIWMSDMEQYMPPVEIGSPMRGGTIGVVEASRSAHFKPGDIASPGLGAWEAYTIAHETMARPMAPPPGAPLTAMMSVLGLTGLTAYCGTVFIGDPKPGETMVVSAAAGAVGSIAGQIGKLRGARVIGIAGGPKKCAWLTEELGFDGAIDYKAGDVGAALDRLCPNGVDVNFENVGGEIMDAVFSRMNKFGRMALCGMISGYNSRETMPGPSDFGRILMRSLTVKGFIVIDYMPRFGEAIAELAPWVLQGRIKWKAHVVDGLENALSALNRLFTGDHDGKLLVRISPEP